jgi:hypothetical protein
MLCLRAAVILASYALPPSPAFLTPHSLERPQAVWHCDNGRRDRAGRHAEDHFLRGAQPRLSNLPGY